MEGKKSILLQIAATAVVTIIGAFVGLCIGLVLGWIAFALVVFFDPALADRLMLSAGLFGALAVGGICIYAGYTSYNEEEESDSQ